MAPFLRNLLLLAAVVTPSLAIPTLEAGSQIHHSSRNGQATSHQSVFKKIRNYIIESIWDVPTKSKCHTSNVKSEHTSPANFRSKYDRDVVLRFNITNDEESKAFLEAASTLYLDIWDHSSHWVDVRVAKQVLPSFLNLLPASLQRSHTPLMHDLAQAIYDTYPSSDTTESWRIRHGHSPVQNTNLFFENYQPLSVINPWLDFIAALFPEHATLVTIGKSAEGRDIRAIHLSAPLQDQKPSKDVDGRETILVVGGSHGREWVSTSSVSYLAYEFATRYPTKHKIRKILTHFDVIFIPVLNPDGYEYTWTNDRLWHKNRQATSLPFCPGIDIDRSYDFQWNGGRDSSNPCGDSYAGEHPFQAIESKVLIDWAVKQTKDNNVVWTAFLDLHSYSQKVLYPYSYSCGPNPQNFEDLMELALGMTKAFRTSDGYEYTAESACHGQFMAQTNEARHESGVRTDNLRDNSGSSLDYFFEILKVPWAYQVKLRDTGTHGFLLPRDQIVPTGKEMYHALMHVCEFLLSNRGIESIDEDNTEKVDAGNQIASSAKFPQETNEKDWRSQNPESLFNLSTNQEQVHQTNENEEDEWERVYDAELRRR